ncbi:SoxR reducing system RseC family protein [Clostridium sp. PL3]|uniref:SoxR reducing system RseC family protein n=1 Tax=Clostridium thailandense TaxID=2794346 RepID=A0A949WVW0_9CLOT|nr:SoxR reducing system RseC family protein [Clostridium thailandense]MBV7274117.1 SoxR reducing system RseC family protein [Clostridium thailandense]
MKNELIGIVTEARGELALVRPVSHTSCDSAYCCQGEGVSKSVIEVKNEVNANVGDKVIFEAKEVGMIRVAFIVFILPLVLAVLGAVAGWHISGTLGINSQITAIFCGIIFFIISLIIIKFYEKYVSENSRLKPIIIRKI